MEQSNMNKPLAGVKVLEVAAWTFVPACGAILADLGADVIKVEPPTGDPQRALKNMLNLAKDGPNPFNEIPNRGKRSITLDLRKPEALAILKQIAATADVFLTSYLPEDRTKLAVDVDDIRAVNPNIIYVKGSGWGARGPMADVGGYDLAAGWATSGLAHRLTEPGAVDGPPPQPAAFFDLQGGNTLAGATAMALFKRERTGETSVVDVSLMNVGMWALAADIVGAPFQENPMVAVRTDPGNPITNWYKTSDDRWIYLVCLQADRFWGELCNNVLDRPDLATDERYANMGVRYQNRAACVADLDAIFAAKPLEYWKQRLATFSGVWAPVLTSKEIHSHPQIDPNGFLPHLTDNEGVNFRIVSTPMQFDGQPTVPESASPELGQHTEDILLEIGMDWDQISAARDQGLLG
jgi:crotonobetainyl-CoA:carnitine CoA-transferase CaiB-like acyl-CoA transferase